MILKIKSWCEGIIVAIVISIIIEMILPDGKNKKYVKVVIGIYIMFVVLNPILEILNYDINIEKIFEFDDIQASTTLDSNIKDAYIYGIQESLKMEIEGLGYEVENVNVYVDENYENIEKIELKVKEKNNKIESIKPITIGNLEEKSNLSYIDIIEYIKENYSVSDDKIIFR